MLQYFQCSLNHAWPNRVDTNDGFYWLNILVCACYLLWGLAHFAQVQRKCTKNGGIWVFANLGAVFFPYPAALLPLTSPQFVFKVFWISGFVDAWKPPSWRWFGWLSVAHTLLSCAEESQPWHSMLLWLGVYLLINSWLRIQPSR